LRAGKSTMTKRTTIAVGFLCIVCLLGSFIYVYRDADSQPHGQWKAWGQFYSPTEKRWVQYMEFENGIWRDTNDTGNPYDRTQQPNFIPLSGELRKEYEASREDIKRGLEETQKEIARRYEERKRQIQNERHHE